MNLQDLLPEKISDESAYHLTTFLMNLALELQSYYFVQLRRHIDDTTPHQIDASTADEFDDEITF